MEVEGLLSCALRVEVMDVDHIDWDPLHIFHSLRVTTLTLDVFQASASVSAA